MKQALFLISRLHEKGNRFIVDMLKKNGMQELVPSHGDILSVLYHNEKATMKDIADKIHRTKPTVTVLVDKLEKLDFVKRAKSPDDNRITYIVLTEKAKQFRKVFEKISDELNTMFYKNLPKEEALKLDEILVKML